MQEFFKNVKIIKKPISKTVVVFQCDEYFFNNYGIFNLLSCEENNLDAHIHFINPSQSFLNKIDNIKTNIKLSYSTESIDTNINFYKLKSYYFCSRYFIANYLFETTPIESAFISDADIIFNKSIYMPEKIKLGVLYYPKHNNLWKQTGANITYIHKDKKIFLERIIEIYNKKIKHTDFNSISETMNKIEKANLYALDQVCMSLIVKDFINDDFLNLASIKNFIGKNRSNDIWSLTGAGQKSNPEVKDFLQHRFIRHESLVNFSN